MGRFVDELQRRHVFKVLASYAVVAWLLIQIIVAVENPLGLPSWSDTFVIVALIIGFPICAVLAWLYDITSSGIERTEPGKGADPVRSSRADRWWITVAIAGAVLLAVTSAYFVLGNPGRTLDTLAIIPFEYVGNDDGSRYLGGVGDSLVTRLSRMPNLRIKSGVAGQDDDLQAIGRLLEVDAVCIGRVEQRDNALGVVVELIDTDDGSIIWRDEFSSEGTSLIAIETEMAAQIAQQLGFELSAEEDAALRRAPTNNAAAHRLYLQGRNFWNRRTPEGFDASIEYYNRAIALDPNYGLAYSGLAHTYLMILGWGLRPPAEVAPLVVEAAEAAIRLDATLAEPHAALGYLKTLYDRDWDGARQDFLRAIELNPSYSSAHHWYAFLLLTEGNVDAALEEIRLARELEPMSPIINAEVGYFYRFSGDYEGALRELQDAARLDRNYESTVRSLIVTNALLGRREETFEQFQRLQSIADSDSLASIFSSAVLPRFGRADEARDVYEALLAEAETTYVMPGVLGFLAAALGEQDAAFAHFDAALEERSLVVSWLRDPLLEDLREDLRLAEIFERVGLEL